MGIIISYKGNLNQNINPKSKGNILIYSEMSPLIVGSGSNYSSP